MSYYNRLTFETEGHIYENYARKVERMSDCNRFWFMDRYDLAKIKDFKKTNLCRDKFCSNCKKVKQASRMGKFIPLIEPYKDNLYQMVLTVPNMAGNALLGSIKEMSECYAKLIDYLKGRKLIKGIDFKKYGYLGSIRSLEITYRGDSYHPHYHSLIVFENFLGYKKNENVFSKDFLGKRTKRLFSDLEILIQKIWYLLITGQSSKELKITKKVIDSLDLGYSCMLDKSKQDDFQEIFKYIAKGQSENGELMLFDNFKVLEVVLTGIRQIQGYGCFYNLTDDDDDFHEQVDQVYDNIILELKEKENPLSVLQRPMDLMKNDGFTIISRKRVFKYLRELN